MTKLEGMVKAANERLAAQLSDLDASSGDTERLTAQVAELEREQAALKAQLTAAEGARADEVTWPAAELSPRPAATAVCHELVSAGPLSF